MGWVLNVTLLPIWCTNFDQSKKVVLYVGNRVPFGMHYSLGVIRAMGIGKWAGNVELKWGCLSGCFNGDGNDGLMS